LAFTLGCTLLAPPATGTPGPAHPEVTPSPDLTGSVVLEEGRCCVGGEAGSDVDILAVFEAASPHGQITEMRIGSTGGGCWTEAEMPQAPWEPFAPDKTLTVTGIPINWLGHYVSAQFRDDQGNVSPVFCDDISIEGMPAPPM
jgi:hypothetical protein